MDTLTYCLGGDNDFLSSLKYLLDVSAHSGYSRVVETLVSVVRGDLEEKL